MINVIENMTTIEEVMDGIDQPMFLLDAQGKDEFLFRRLNRSHLKATGLDPDAMVGKRPHDVLPPRLADTVVQNYEKCRASGKVYKYEENLELPSGTRWWQTCLSPLKDVSGQVTKIVGIAVDITEDKERFFEASQKLSEMTRLNEDLQVFAATSAHDLRGPFQTMVALLNLVMDSFVDLGDEKMDQLILCSEIATNAIGSMDSILDVAQGLHVEHGISEMIDIHHVGSDIAALLDPEDRLSIDLPRVVVEIDRVALQMVLRNVMENAVRYTNGKVSVTVSQGAGEFVCITVSDDGVGQSDTHRSDGTPVLPIMSDDGGGFGLQSGRAVVMARGGQIEQVQCPFPMGASVQFSLPGKLATQSSLRAAHHLKTDAVHIPGV